MNAVSKNRFGRKWGWVALVGCMASAATAGCELLVDFDRSKIPEEGGTVDATTDDSSEDSPSETSTTNEAGESGAMESGTSESGSETGVPSDAGKDGSVATEAGKDASASDTGTVVDANDASSSENEDAAD